MKKSIPYKNANLVYHVYGKGTPVILLHGFAETNTIWQKQSEFLSNYCMVIAPDLPGSGESDLFDTGDKNLSIDEVAECIHSIINNESIDQCILLGHSMGGYVVLSYAEKYGRRLKAFGLIHSTAFADSEEKKQNRKRGIEMMDAYGSRAFLKTTTPNLFTDAFRRQNTAVVNQMVEEGRRFKKENLQQYYHAMMQREDKVHVLTKSAVPVLFVLGIEDVAAPLSDVLRQVHEPEITYIHIIEHTGHMSMLETPKKLNRILKNFVNETE